MELDYVRLAPGFAREVLEIDENWQGKDTVPMKVRELMLMIEIEVNKLYDPGGWARVAETPKAAETQRYEDRVRFSTSRR